MIPIADLMQGRHPGYRVFLEGREISRDHYHLFLSYCLSVDKKFRYYAMEHNGSTFTDASLMRIAMLMRSLDETDEPEDVFPMREQLRNAVYEFRHYCEKMSSRFTRPGSIKEFYIELGELILNVAFDYAGLVDNSIILGGDSI